MADRPTLGSIQIRLRHPVVGIARLRIIDAKTQSGTERYLRVAATLKHFYGNNTEVGRGWKNVSIDPRNKYELYLEQLRIPGGAHANWLHERGGRFRPSQSVLVYGRYFLVRYIYIRKGLIFGRISVFFLI